MPYRLDQQGRLVRDGQWTWDDIPVGYYRVSAGPGEPIDTPVLVLQLQDGSHYATLFNTYFPVGIGNSFHFTLCNLNFPGVDNTNVEVNRVLLEDFRGGFCFSPRESWPWYVLPRELTGDHGRRLRVYLGESEPSPVREVSPLQRDVVTVESVVYSPAAEDTPDPPAEAITSCDGPPTYSWGSSLLIDAAEELHSSRPSLGERFRSLDYGRVAPLPPPQQALSGGSA